jgi:hypothetical protein
MAAAVPQWLKAAMTPLSLIPGVTEVTPDRKLYPAQVNTAVCNSGTNDIFSSNGSSREWIPYGIRTVQALDPTIINVSRSAASKVGPCCREG